MNSIIIIVEDKQDIFEFKKRLSSAQRFIDIMDALIQEYIAYGFLPHDHIRRVMSDIEDVQIITLTFIENLSNDFDKHVEASDEQLKMLFIEAVNIVDDMKTDIQNAMKTICEGRIALRADPRMNTTDNNEIIVGDLENGRYFSEIKANQNTLESELAQLISKKDTVCCSV